MQYDPLEYVRNYYGVPATKGKHVQYKDRRGVVTGASGPHVLIKLEGDKSARPYHPTDKDLNWLGEKTPSHPAPASKDSGT